MLKDQGDVALTGNAKCLVQLRAIRSKFRVSSSVIADGHASYAQYMLGMKRQFVRINRIVPPFPVHTDHPDSTPQIYCGCANRTNKEPTGIVTENNSPFCFFKTSKNRSFKSISRFHCTRGCSAPSAQFCASL